MAGRSRIEAELASAKVISPRAWDILCSECRAIWLTQYTRNSSYPVWAWTALAPDGLGTAVECWL